MLLCPCKLTFSVIPKRFGQQVWNQLLSQHVSVINMLYIHKYSIKVLEYEYITSHFAVYHRNWELVRIHAMQLCYNMVLFWHGQFSPNQSQQTPHWLPLWVMIIFNLYLELCPASATTALYSKLYHMWLNCNGTQWYFSQLLICVVPCNIHFVQSESMAWICNHTPMFPVWFNYSFLSGLTAVKCQLHHTCKQH